MVTPSYTFRLSQHGLELDADGHHNLDDITDVDLSTAPVLDDVLTFDGTKWIASAPAGATSFGTPTIVLGTTAAAGAASTAVRTDATIVAFDATAPTTSAIGDAAAVGSVAKAARRDHAHGREALSTATPLIESGSGSTGTGVKSSREDHVHPASTSGTSASDTSIWRPLSDGAGGVIYDAGTGEIIMAYGPT